MATPFQLPVFLTGSRIELICLPLMSSLQLLGTARADNTFHFRMRIRFRGNVFTNAFLSIGRLFLFIKNLLPRNGRRSVVGFVADAYKRMLFQSR
jgi:hypothetical protein